jgi:bifunctional non-homologous end joining protein LigD
MPSRKQPPAKKAAKKATRTAAKKPAKATKKATGASAAAAPTAAPESTDRLERYRQKRSPEKTNEPFGGASASGRLFVFHKHHARNLHWDLRLEWEGALESWAVPKGPSPNPAEKRLAMHVEPHPLDYGEFEGVIPDGQYGAGPSIVWDKGTWIPLEDVKAGFAKGKLLFELWGYKVKGRWTLIHTPKAGPKNWLLIKEKDEHVDKAGTPAYPDDSIYSGLDVDDLPRAAEIEAELVDRALRAGAKKKSVDARDVEVMKATRREDAFSDPDWVYELKYDGYRLIAGVDDGDSVLISRNGNDLTHTFPEVARAVRGLPYQGLVLDGEVVVHDDRGLPSFGHLQKRGRLQNRKDIARASLELPATYYAFDLLAIGGADLRGLPLLERKALLRDVIPTVGPLRYSDHVAEQGKPLMAQVQQMGLEGIVAKRADSTYTGGRSKSWYKIPALHTEDFVIVGFTDPSTGRPGFGALHMARYVGDTLTWAGSVGTGYTEADLNRIRKALGPLEDASARELVAGAPKARGSHWVKPELVAEVTFKDITSDGMIRHGSFMRLRDDKRPEECRAEAEELAEQDEPLAEPAPVAPATSPETGRTIKLTNLDKVFWPEPGFTKRDLIDYYRAISPWLLPYLADRPVVLTRYPDGVTGKSFYQKDAPEWTPDWIRTVPVEHDGGEKTVNYFVADDLDTLTYLANLGSVPLHIWHSRAADLGHPDWCLLDLDPKDAPFAHVVEIALFLHELCGELELPHYVKTSGSSGLHVLIPLGGRMDYDQSVTLGELIARTVVKKLPRISTIERVVKKRAGKVYVDFLQNRQGQLMAAPFSAREKPGATVSAPLLWKEVGKDLSLADYTIETMPPRMKKLKGDPLAPVLTESPDLIGALEKLMKK